MTHLVHIVTRHTDESGCVELIAACPSEDAVEMVIEERIRYHVQREEEMPGFFQVLVVPVRKPLTIYSVEGDDAFVKPRSLQQALDAESSAARELIACLLGKTPDGFLDAYKANHAEAVAATEEARQREILD